MKKRLSFTIAFMIIAITSIAQLSDTVVTDKNYQRPIFMPTVTDIDGHQYKTVKIGKQVWMAENLTVSHFRNGDSISEIKDNKAWVKIFNVGKTAWCNYKNDAGYGQKYGKLYNLNAVKDRRNLAPKGWHIPTDADWTILANHLGGWQLAGKKMKTTYGWYKSQFGFDDRGNGTNESGFAALPTGFRGGDGKFDNGEVVMDQFATWWSSSKTPTYDALAFEVDGDSGGFGNDEHYEGFGLAVRCVKD